MEGSDIRAAMARVGRGAYRRLPRRAQEQVRRGYDLVRPTIDGGIDVQYPADVADETALRSFLTDTSIFTDKAEAEGYLSDAFERFRITMALIPDVGPGTKVLELGANPYFLTRLLRRRGVDVTCANYFGDGWPGPNVQSMVSRTTGVDETYEFDHFNVEREAFPYPDKSFDVVLFCEILEHLPSDPIHTLAEIHRVLTPGGTLVLTTPNASRLTNLVRIWRGENIYEEMSGYGAYGRHNREYTVAELDALLRGCGYAVERNFAADLHARSAPLPRAVDLVTEHRGDNLFVVATPFGEARWHYPRWLYSSRHALKRTVRPDFLAGHNDVLQGHGFHDAEQLGGVDACWTGALPTATVTLAPEASSSGRITVDGWAPPPAAGKSIRLTASIGGDEAEWEIVCNGERFIVDSPLALGPHAVELRTDRTWSPAAVGLNQDGRSLGVAVHRVAVVPG